MRKLNLILKKFGRLTVIAEAPSRGKPKRARWLCRCECGNEVTVAASDLRSGHTRSCGCLVSDVIRETKTKHGMTFTPEWLTWTHMNARCYSPTASHFSHYGGREVPITVCDEWRDDFAAFYRDMGPRPSPQHTLERKDNNGPYSKDNCVWATKREQAQNRRSNVYLTFQGKTLCVSEWARVLEIGVSTLFNRLRRGWPVEKILTPVKKHT